MKKIFHVPFFIIAFVIGISIVHVTGCANIIPPTGGPRDSLPPVLIHSVPKDSSINFHSKQIVLTFDEYVQLDQKINENFIVSPNPENTPFPEAKLKTVTIKLRDSLKPNTTYSLDFGNSLKDINEGNEFRNFTYVFSTGNRIDTGTLSGNVILAETGSIDSTLIVVLHNNLNDTAVVKNRPDYYTRLDSIGNFRFRFMPSQTYAVYVLPNDFVKKYDDSTKMFAFYNSPVTIGKTTGIQLYAYQEVKQKDKIEPAAEIPSTGTKKEQAAEEKRLRFTTNLENNEQDILGNFEIDFNRKITKFDSNQVALTDTNYNPVKGLVIKQDTSRQKFFLQFNWPEDQAYRLVIQKEAFTDSTGVSLPKNDTIKFTTKKESDYGSVRLHFNNIDLAKNPVLEMIQNDNIIKSIPLTSADWYTKLFEPGQYELRVLFDNNRNGIWDPGNFIKKIQPEIVQKIRHKLNIKPNWDNEVDINL
jgi:hypothetical protein